MRRAELPALTGIRFYAALLVFVSHIVAIPGMDVLGGHRLIFNAGVVGVAFFFVLSGFILTYNYADLFRNGIAASVYRRFVWDRWTKLYPVHFAALLLVLPIQVYSPNLPLDWRAVPFHLFLAQCWWPITQPTFYNYLNVPSWSISCEWFFYLVAPFIICFSAGKSRRWTLAALLAAYAGALGLWLSHASSDFTRLYLVSWFAPSRLPEFVTGVFLARVFLRLREGRLKGMAVYAQGLGIMLIAAGAIYRPHAPWPFWGGLLYIPGSALLILGLAYGRGFFAAHLGQPWLRLLGMASFSFYLLHAPLIRAFKGACLYLGWEVRSWPIFWLVTVILFVLIQSTAIAVYYFYEAPVQKKLRALVRRPPSVPMAPQARILSTAGL